MTVPVGGRDEQICEHVCSQTVSFLLQRHEPPYKTLEAAPSILLYEGYGYIIVFTDSLFAHWNRQALNVIHVPLIPSYLYMRALVRTYGPGY